MSQLTKSLQCSVTFSPTSCIFQDLRTKKTIGSGHEKDGLYYLDPGEPPTSVPTALSATVSPLQWHYRLGHPSLAKLRAVIPTLSPISVLECEACQLGKHHRSSFSSSSVRQTESFAAVHTDIWGPSRTPSLNGYCYFVIFVFDYSRMTWIFLMKNRSELPNVVLKFYNEIFVQFDKRIKVIRSDNALEYTKNVMQTFCNERGLIHQNYNVQTPQQNGQSERKNRHILDLARAMCITMNVIKSYWSDAVLTANYLINRMPSSVTGNHSPISLLYSDLPPFSLTPRVFGCVAFVHVFDLGLDKLSPRSRKCVFLGYSRTQKGYRCYHPESRRYFGCADVTFFESTPFFFTLGQDLSLDVVLSREGEHLPLPIPITNRPSLPIPVDDPPLKVYQRQHSRPIVPYAPTTSSSQPEVPTLPTIVSHDTPVASRTRSKYPIAGYVSFDRLSPSLQSFALSLSTVTVPTSYKEALSSPGWKFAMDEEMCALKQNKTWELTTLPPGKHTVGCRWVYTVKYHPDGSVERLKARLVAKGYTQQYGIDYS